MLQGPKDSGYVVLDVGGGKKNFSNPSTSSEKDEVFSCPGHVGLSHREIPRNNSGTAEPVPGPLVPLFPQPPIFQGHNSQKRGTGPE
jgi:hypothetical protein